MDADGGVLQGLRFTFLTAKKWFKAKSGSGSVLILSTEFRVQWLVQTDIIFLAMFGILPIDA